MTITQTPTVTQEGRWEPSVGWSVAVLPTLDPFFPRVPAWRYTGLQTSDEGIRYESAAWTLPLLAPTGFERAGRFNFYVRVTATPGDWSTANPPATFVPGVTGVPIQPEIDAGRVLEVATYDYLATESSLAIALDTGPLNALAGTPDWDGTLSLFATVQAPAGVAATPPVALFNTGSSISLVTDTRANTGMVTWREGTQGRADRCPRCGGISMRDDWIRDGETRVYVCPRCYDIRQVPRRVGRRERGPIHEG